MNNQLGLSDKFYRKYDRYNIVVQVQHDLVVHQKDPIKVLERVIELYIQNYGGLTKPWYKRIF